MSLSLTLKDEAKESRLLKSRVLAAALIILLLVLVLILRLVYLQIISHEHFATLSENNRVKIVPIPPTRGLIYDRDGVILAQNQPSFSLELVPEAVADMDATLASLAKIINIRDVDLERFRKLVARTRSFESIPLRFHLDEDEVARFSVNRYRFPGVDIEARLTRSYPLGKSAVHVVGYVGRIDEQELQELDVANYAGTSHVGKIGVEKAYEDVLHGRVGYQHVETNAQGRTLRVLERTAPVPGSDLHLYLDSSLQLAAEKAMGDEKGAVVAIDPNTGGVLALVSTPGYDPNLFVNGIDADTYRELQRSPDRPLFNRALRGQYPPGSTIKPFVGLAGLDFNLPLAHGDTWCRGWYQLPGKEHRYRDWKRGGHGRVDLNRAILRSCDVYFYELSQDLGIDRLHDFLSRFGFGAKAGIDIGGEVSGLLPSREWKWAMRGQPWYPGETLIAGIGQGFDLVTPLQLAVATATMASHGRHFLPRVVQTVSDLKSGHDIVLPHAAVQRVDAGAPENWDTIIHAMEAVVQSPEGTARRIGVGAPYRIAGKTGTAQVFGIGQEERYNASLIEKKLRDHALFIAFAPADKPRIAVAVVVENGGSGSGTAAPIARQVMDHYLLQESGRADQVLSGAPAGH